MSFIYAESLIELAIRVGIADLAKDPAAVTALLGIDKQLNAGTDMTPAGGEPRFDPTLLDEFQAKVDQLPKADDEAAGMPVFKNGVVPIADVNEYLRTANVRIVHGFPRSAMDLPAVCITLGGESASQEYLGGIKFEALGEQADGLVRVRVGADFGSQYPILILTTNYDETVILYHLIRYGLMKYAPHLEGYGIRQQEMNWQDVEPAPEFLQGGIFAYQRVCVFSCVKAEGFDVASPGYSSLVYSGAAAGLTADTIFPAPEESQP